MSAAADHLLDSRGVQAELDAFVVSARFDRGGAMAAFALGDGTLRLIRPRTAAWTRVAAHDGAILALAADAAPAGWISGGDDGKFLRIGADGDVAETSSHGMKWVDTVAAFTDGKSRLTACSVGRNVHIFDGTGRQIKSLEHPSSVTGLAFDARGKRIAASHYNGASLWFVASKSDNPRRLEWKGSHTGVAISPDGDSVVTSMQENSLHGWRLSDGQHMRMTGYPAKTAALSFTRSGKWLAS